MTVPIQIFIAYSHEDKVPLDELRKYLKPLERNNAIKIWYDGEIIAGSVWDQSIRENLYKSSVIMLLVSANSLASDYFYEKEMRDALARHTAETAIVVPIILSSCAWEITPMKDLQALPKDALPIDKWISGSDAYTDIVRGINRCVETIQQRRKIQTDEENQSKTEQEFLQSEREEAERLRQDNKTRRECEQREQDQKAEQEQIQNERKKVQNKKQFWQQLQAADDLYAQQQYSQAQTAYQTLLQWVNKTDLGCTDAQPHLAKRLLHCQAETRLTKLKVQAYALHQQGKYKDALNIVQQVLQHRTDSDMGNLQKELKHLIQEAAHGRRILLQKAGMSVTGVLVLLVVVWGTIRVIFKDTQTTQQKEAPIGTILQINSVDTTKKNSVPKEINTPTISIQSEIEKSKLHPILDTTKGSSAMGGGGRPNIKMINIPGKNYALSETEITIGQYLVFCKATNSHYPEWIERGSQYNVNTGSYDYYKEVGMSKNSDNYPITGVSALDAYAFCHWMGGRLPTEQEWEYAAKGGQNYEYSGSDDIDAVAWYEGNSGSKCYPVKQKQANGYGLYDMSGNVWEWTSSMEGAYCILRGGSWRNHARSCQIAYRNDYALDYRDNNGGFRLARFVPQ